MNYTHLNQEERYQIHALRRANIALTQIASELGRSVSTISRKLKRSKSARGYKPAHAHTLASARQSDRRNAVQFSCQQMALVQGYPRLELSPQQIAGRLKQEGLLRISTEISTNMSIKTRPVGAIWQVTCDAKRRAISAMPAAKSVGALSRTGRVSSSALRWYWPKPYRRLGG